MFDFLFQNKKGEMVSLLEVVAVNMEKIQLAVLASEKAICMIANAIAKSEIVISTGQQRRKDEVYFRLNIAPNDNQSGTDFWFLVTHRILDRGECLVIPIAGKYYIAESWTCSNTVMYEKVYSNVEITDGADTFRLDKSFLASEVMHFRYGTMKRRIFTQQVLRLYNDAVAALVSMETLVNDPLFKYKVDANMTFAELDASGKPRKLTLDQVIEKLKEQITSHGIRILKEQNGTSLEYMKMDAKVSAGEIKTMSDELNAEAAKAYDIPEDVFTGNITEKSDATNEFITYAVQPVAEVLTDMMSARLVGMEDYVRGERLFVWLSRFKHTDVIDSAANLDKLRGIGFSYDEIREMVGYEPLNTEFSQARALTKNYAPEGEEGDGSTDPADDPDEAGKNRQHSKHKERRKYTFVCTAYVEKSY